MAAVGESSAEALLERSSRARRSWRRSSRPSRARAVGRLVLIAGEAGIGKTALVRSFCWQAAPARVLSGACDALHTPRPLGPLVDIAEQTGGELAELVDGCCRRRRSAGRVHPGSCGGGPERGRARRPPLGGPGHARPRPPARTPDRDRPRARARDLSRRRARAGTSAADRARRASPDQLAAAVARSAVGGRGERSGRPAWDRAGRAALADRRQPVLRDRSARLGRGVDPRRRARRGARARGAAATTARGCCSTPSRSRRSAPSSACSRRSAPDQLVHLETCLASGMLRAERDGVAFRHEIARATIEDALPPDRAVDASSPRARALIAAPQRTRRPGEARAPRRGGRRTAMPCCVTRRPRRTGPRGSAPTARPPRSSGARCGTPAGSPSEERAELLERRSYECYLTTEIDEAIEARRAALAEHARRGDRLREGDCHRWLSRLLWFNADNAAASTKATGGGRAARVVARRAGSSRWPTATSRSCGCSPTTSTGRAAGARAPRSSPNSSARPRSSSIR